MNAIIVGRRWFNKGNTYHTSTVVVFEREEVIFEKRSEITYGYEDQYISTGIELIPKEILEKLPTNEFGRVKALSFVSDVGKKKNL